ncbi:zinc finger CCCH domain-containing protein 34-like [Actinidia eriantha]|uniref:zinc finger CCCH domain-containing protein 34-like n=1 Tax=Actinidia eriantha TaxID=165200 RepID=UPI00258D15BE|nr:zinc finger CCCH domain-containing protein 34-like [Actinidia eriantha]
MDDELLKRFTDCVYFLASPLTCKKGIECEYRHSEVARLNPRDCWYWLTGSCLNPSCAFRHPPLDAHTEVSSESAPAHQSTASVNKFSVPCYFYFNGFCSKGDRCSFLHGPPGDATPAWKSSNTPSAVNVAPPPLENKTSAVSDEGSALIETLPNPSEFASKRSMQKQINLKADFCLSSLDNVKDQNDSPQMSASECEEASPVRSDIFLPGRDLIQLESLLSTDQSTEELVDGHVEREDYLESSPGFDVLVDDDRLENLGYEDDPDYLPAIDREGRGLNGHIPGYDHGDPIEDDPTYPDARMYYEQERLYASDLFDNEQRFYYFRNFHGRSREEILDPIMPRKRKFLVTDGHRGVNLRDHLKKRRVIDGRLGTHFSRRNNSALLVDRRRERSRHLLTDKNPRDSFKPSHSKGLWQRYREKRRPKRQILSSEVSKKPFLSSEVSKKPVSRKRRSTEESTAFSRPKTLSQIKEEKRKATENGNSYGWLGDFSSRNASEEFQGPKPLSEILKEKNKMGPVTDSN